MDDVETLQMAGLTENDSKIYYHLLKEGRATGSAAAGKLGLHRRNVYESLERLSNKGLASFVLINGRKYYSANVTEMLGALEDRKKAIEELIPELEKPHLMMKVPEVQILTGKEGMKILFRDEYLARKPIHIIAAKNYEKKTWDYFDITPDKIVALGLKIKLLYPETERALGERAKKGRGKAIEVRYLPEKYSSDVGIEVYGDNVAIELEEDLILKMKSEKAAKRFMDYFNILWELAKK